MHHELYCSVPTSGIIMSSSRITLEKDIWIDAPPTAVRSVFDDTSLIPRLFPRTTLVRADDHWPKPGSTLIVQYQIVGLTFDLHLSSTDHTPASFSKALSITNAQFSKPVQGGIHYRWSERDGGTRISAIWEYNEPEDLLVRELERWMIRSLNVDHLEISLENIKRWIETGKL